MFEISLIVVAGTNRDLVAMPALDVPRSRAREAAAPLQPSWLAHLLSSTPMSLTPLSFWHESRFPLVLAEVGPLRRGHSQCRGKSRKVGRPRLLGGKFTLRPPVVRPGGVQRRSPNVTSIPFCAPRTTRAPTPRWPRAMCWRFHPVAAALRSSSCASLGGWSSST